MIASPTNLQRPLLVLAGWRTPRWMGAALARELRRLTGADSARTLAVSVLTCNTMERAVQCVIARASEAWPSDDPRRTVDVDVVGISMGGLLARAAALPDPADKRKQLMVHRLFTLGTPHRGAVMARRIAIDAPSRDMRAGSHFLRRLDDSLATSTIELICYARTYDVMVGATNAAPEGHEPFWLHGPRLFSHVTMWADPLIRLDIARRLRGEEPLARKASRPPRD